MGAVEAVAAPLLGGPLAAALEAGRDRYNARIAAARRGAPGFDAERFARRFAATARPAVEAVAAAVPDRTQVVTDALFEIAIDLASRGALGPAVAGAADDAWTIVLPAVAPLLAASPDRVTRALTNAVGNLALIQGARPGDWVSCMAEAGPACATEDDCMACGLVAAWTAGAAHFRSRALAALASLPAAAARPVLGLPPDAIEVEPRALAARLGADPWLPPALAGAPPADRSLEISHTAGGFRGLGGAFMTPPAVAVWEGRFVAADGQAVWLLFADACGATLVRADAPPPEAGVDADRTAPFRLRSTGRVTIDGHDRTFPVLADASSAAATATTLVVAVPRSHDLFVLALVPRRAS